MCFRFDAWCCFGAVHDHDDDYSGSPPKPAPPPHHHHAAAPAKTTTAPHHHPLPNQRNGHHHYGHAQHGHQGAVHHANGHRAPPHQTPADEEDRKASNDARRGHAPAAGAATNGVHGYAAGAQQKAYVYSGADGTLKHPAANTKVADGAGHGANYYYQLEPAHREQYYHYH